MAQQRRPRSNKNRQKSSQQNAWEWSWEEESTPTRPASLREAFPPNSKHLVVDVGKHGPRAEATRRRFRTMLHQPCRPHGNQTRTSPRRQHKQPALQRMPGTSAELALCLREAYPDPKSMPESALKALTKVDVRSSKQTQLWLHLLPDELDIPKPAAPVTAREYNRVHASRNYRFKMIQRLCWRLFSRALPQPLKDDYTLLISIQVEAGQKTFTTGCPSCLTRRD